MLKMHNRKVGKKKRFTFFNKKIVKRLVTNTNVFKQSDEDDLQFCEDVSVESFILRSFLVKKH